MVGGNIDVGFEDGAVAAGLSGQIADSLYPGVIFQIHFQPSFGHGGSISSVAGMPDGGGVVVKQVGSRTFVTAGGMFAAGGDGHFACIDILRVIDEIDGIQIYMHGVIIQPGIAGEIAHADNDVIFIHFYLITDAVLGIAIGLIVEAGNIHNVAEAAVVDVGEVLAVMNMTGEDHGLWIVFQNGFQVFFTFTADPVELFVVSCTLESLVNLNEDWLFRIGSFQNISQSADLFIGKVSLVLQVLFGVQGDEVIAVDPLIVIQLSFRGVTHVFLVAA